MSRVGKYPVELPADVQVAIASGILTAKGRLGELALRLTDLVEAKVEGNKVSVAPRSNETKARMMWGYHSRVDREHGEGRFHRLCAVAGKSPAPVIARRLPVLTSK